MLNKEEIRLDRTVSPKQARLKSLLNNPNFIEAELCRRSFQYFIKSFWNEIVADSLQWNWHMGVLADELQVVAERVGEKRKKAYDLLANVPPGSSKSLITSIMFPAWCWTRWPWMRFIVSSYATTLSMEHSELCRELVRSDLYKKLFPQIQIKLDKDTKTNFAIMYQEAESNGVKAESNLTRTKKGGNRFATSVGGTLTGFHGHILIVDDPLNPKQAASDVELSTANTWIDQTLSTRKVDKAVTPTIIIMQRLHQNDVTGYLLDKRASNIRHICLPADISGEYAQYVQPKELAKYYVEGLLDPVRMSHSVIEEYENALGQYGYAAQFGQSPTPPSGGMFQVDRFTFIHAVDPRDIVDTVRYWDKAATVEKRSAYTCGVKMAKLRNNKFLILDVIRGKWTTEKREQVIRSVAETDGVGTDIWHEQEPGSGGKDSAAATTRNLAGFNVYTERATGDKVVRADPYSVQVNNGNVILLTAEWNKDYLDELRFAPFSKFKDQMDASSGAFNKLAQTKKEARACGHLHR